MDLTMYRPPLSGRRYSGLGAGPPMFAAPYGLMPMMGGMGGGLGMDPFSLMGMGMGMAGMGGMGRSRRSLHEMPYGYGGFGGRGGSRFIDPYEMMFDDVYDDEYLEDFDDIEDPLLFYLRMMRGGQGRRGRRRLGGLGRF